MGWPFDDDDDKKNRWEIDTGVTTPQQAQQGYINAWTNLSALDKQDFLKGGAGLTDKRLAFQKDANKQYLGSLSGSGDKGKLGWNTGTFNAAGSILEGLGAVGTAWAGLQGVKLGKAELAELKDQWSKNYASQAITTNNQIANQNAWKTAQGRTDLSDLVPRYNNIG